MSRMYAQAFLLFVVSVKLAAIVVKNAGWCQAGLLCALAFDAGTAMLARQPENRHHD